MSTISKPAEKRSTRSTLKGGGRSSSRSLEKRLSFKSQEDSSGDIARLIVDEIVENSLKKIHEKYLKDQTIRFVVHCAHEALTRVLRMHFYQHNDYNRDLEHWGPEQRIPPSNADSWAAHQVPVSKSISASEQELNSLSLIQLEMEAKNQEMVIDTVDERSVISEQKLEDIRQLIDDIIENLPLIDVAKSEESLSTVSAFTMVVEGTQHFDTYKMAPQLSRISAVGDPSFPSFFKLPKIDLPESGNSRRYQSLTELSNEIGKLPPIRTDADYKCRPPPPPPDSKKNKNKKK